jgi:hypothetical protein
MNILEIILRFNLLLPSNSFVISGKNMLDISNKNNYLINNG